MMTSRNIQEEYHMFVCSSFFLEIDLY